jgi:hypothetical protein
VPTKPENFHSPKLTGGDQTAARAVARRKPGQSAALPRVLRAMPRYFQDRNSDIPRKMTTPEAVQSAWFVPGGDLRYFIENDDNMILS